MANEPTTTKALQVNQRQARLAEQLRSNLKKRKLQARERAKVSARANRRPEGNKEERS